MILGTVVGNLWSTKKSDALRGQAFLTVAASTGETLVCADCVGAGVGETVLVTTGSAARVAAGLARPVDAAIVGIVDMALDLDVEIESE